MRRSGSLGPTLLLAVYALAATFPILWVVSLSVKPDNIMLSRPPVWLFTPTLEHYHYVLVEKALWNAVLDSVIASFASTVLVVVIGTPAAYSLARFEIRRRDDWFLFILGTRMAPPIALTIPFYLMFSRLQLLNSHAGLILAYLTFNLSFYIWVLRSFCREIPYQLEEAAMTAGYSRWQIFLRVALPLLRPGIIATALLCLIFAWNEFLYAFILGGRDVQTLPVAIPGLITPGGVKWGPLAALGLIAVVPVLAVVFTLQRHIVRGLTRGGREGLAARPMTVASLRPRSAPALPQAEGRRRVQEYASGRRLSSVLDLLGPRPRPERRPDET